MKKKFFIMCLLITIIVFIGSTCLIRTVDAKNSNDFTQSEFVGNMTCGGIATDGKGLAFHKSLPSFTNKLYDILKVLTPVIIIVTGMLDMLKATTAQKEDEMKKAQKKFLNRLLAGIVVFLIFAIVEVVVGLIAKGNSDNVMNCIECFLSDYNKCQTIP